MKFVIRLGLSLVFAAAIVLALQLTANYFLDQYELKTISFWEALVIRIIVDLLRAELKFGPTSA